jgi:hypothetical protein
MREYTLDIPATITMKVRAEDYDEAMNKAEKAVRDNEQSNGKIFITLPVGWNNIDIFVRSIDPSVVDVNSVLIEEQPF